MRSGDAVQERVEEAEGFLALLETDLYISQKRLIIT